MNILDLSLVILLGIFFYKDYRKGFTGVIFSLLAIIAGLYLSTRFYLEFSIYLHKIISSKQSSEIVAFIVIFVVTNFAINTLGNYFRKLLDHLYLGWINSILGGIIGLAKGFLLVGAILMMVSYLSIPFFEKETSHSKLTPYVSSLFNKTFKIAASAFPDELKNKGKEFIDTTINSKK